MRDNTKPEGPGTKNIRLFFMLLSLPSSCAHKPFFSFRERCSSVVSEELTLADGWEPQDIPSTVKVGIWGVDLWASHSESGEAFVSPGLLWARQWTYPVSSMGDQFSSVVCT